MESDRTSQEKGTDFQLVASSDDDFQAGGYKRCKICGEEQPLDEFWVEAKGVMGRKAICKKCLNTAEGFKRNDFGPRIKRPAKRGEIPLKTIRKAVSKVTNDRIQQALEAAAYRYLKEIM